MSKLDSQSCREFIFKEFEDKVIPSICQYIKIDNLSRCFDPHWDTNGKLEKAANHICDWIQQLGISGLNTRVIKDQGYSPIIFTEVKGTFPQTLFFYGHYDKQPPMKGWSEGLGATIPVIKDGKLYGRGGADDGYSTYSTLLAIKALQEQKLKLPRLVMITEGDQESGSGHMPYYLKKLKQEIGEPSSFFCLDSGTLDYDRLWLTNSLRGNVIATLRVQVSSQGYHSGQTSGTVPSCFRIARSLLNRIENSDTGQINERFHVNIPPKRYKQTLDLAQTLKGAITQEFPFLEGVTPISSNPFESLINRTWKPSLTVLGQTGFPQCQGAGNVLLPFIQLKFSLRIPPTFKKEDVHQILTEILTTNVPYNAKVQIKNFRASGGWNAADYEDYLQKAVEEASKIFYGNDLLCLGQGGTIPLMNVLDELWPNRPFLITGVLGPHSNAHGPNQFLEIEYCKKITCCLAYIVAKTAEHLHQSK